MKKLFLILGIIILPIVGFAQRALPNEEDLVNAKSLSKRYEDERLIITDIAIEVNFQLNRAKGLVGATLSTKTDFLNIGSAFRMKYPVIYDSESDVVAFTVRDHRSKFLTPTIQDEYLENSDLFHSDYRVKYTTLDFPLQGIKKSVSTKQEYSDVKYLTSIYCSEEFRILKGTIKIVIPDWLEVAVNEYYLDQFSIDKTVANDKGNKIITYSYKDLSPMYQEAHSPGPSHTYPHLVIVAKSYSTGNEKFNLFSEVDDLYQWYHGLIGNVVEEPKVYREKVQEITANCQSPQEKAQKIFYWVQDNIRYVAFEDGIAGFQPTAPQEVFEKRYGDCKGMAILTKSMLQEAGLDASLVWIGTDRLVYDYSFPSLAVDNHMICALRMNEKLYFLDATEKYSEFGTYATRIAGREAMIDGQGSYTLMRVPENTTQNEEATDIKLLFGPESLKGIGARTYQGESKVWFQNYLHSFGRDEQSDVLASLLSNNNTNAKVYVGNDFDSDVRGNQLQVPFTIIMENSVSEFDGTYYVDIDTETYKNLDLSERKNDYLVPFKEKVVTEITIEVPNGFEVVEMPESLLIQNDLVDITVDYNNQNVSSGNQVSYRKSINFKKRNIEKKQFDLWNETFQKLRETIQQQIVIQKK
ncbi:MAG: transglutaminase-like domain-containing protein [Flavobacteriaceae bacterium]